MERWENEKKNGVVFESKEYLFENNTDIENFANFSTFCQKKLEDIK
jgi:hypothetical protein